MVRTFHSPGQTKVQSTGTGKITLELGFTEKKSVFSFLYNFTMEHRTKNITLFTFVKFRSIHTHPMPTPFPAGECVPPWTQWEGSNILWLGRGWGNPICLALCRCTSKLSASPASVCCPTPLWFHARLNVFKKMETEGVSNENLRSKS
jgi:hypothetical protein